MIRQRGFSLLEILVAFSILALSLGVLMQIYSDAARNAGLVHDQAQATSLAQSLLADASIESIQDATEQTGALDGKFQWKVQVAPFEEADNQGSTSGQPSPALVDLWQITASVTWTGPPMRSVTLTTLRTHPRLSR